METGKAVILAVPAKAADKLTVADAAALFTRTTDLVVPTAGMVKLVLGAGNPALEYPVGVVSPVTGAADPPTGGVPPPVVVVPGPIPTVEAVSPPPPPPPPPQPSNKTDPSVAEIKTTNVNILENFINGSLLVLQMNAFQELNHVTL